LKRKWIAVLLVLACMATMCSVASAADIQTKPGQSLTYTVSLQNEAKLAGFKVYVDYDTSVFSLASSDGEFLVEQGGFSTKGTMMANTTETGCSVLWYHTSNITASGSLFTLTLNVSADAEPGTYPVTLRYEADDTVNVEEEAVVISLTGPSVVIPEPQSVNKVAISVPDCNAVVGETVSVPVNISENTGFAGLAIQIPALNGVTFTGAEKGSLIKNNETGALTVNNATRSVNWSDSENTTGDGEILVLHFSVSEDCLAGEYEISISLIGNASKNFVDCDSVSIPVQFTAGTLTVVDYILGDVDDDGEITGSDAVQMARHIVGFEMLSGKAFKAADLDADGVITTADCVKIARYLVGYITSFS